LWHPAFFWQDCCASHAPAQRSATQTVNTQHRQEPKSQSKECFDEPYAIIEVGWFESFHLAAWGDQIKTDLITSLLLQNIRAVFCNRAHSGGFS